MLGASNAATISSVFLSKKLIPPSNTFFFGTNPLDLKRNFKTFPSGAFVKTILSFIPVFNDSYENVHSFCCDS